jgi:hypothetical protein
LRETQEAQPQERLRGRFTEANTPVYPGMEFAQSANSLAVAAKRQLLPVLNHAIWPKTEVPGQISTRTSLETGQEKAG